MVVFAAAVVIASALTAPVTTTGAEVPVPNELVQDTVIEFEPSRIGSEFVLVLVDACVALVELVRVIEHPPDGIVDPPSTE